MSSYTDPANLSSVSPGICAGLFWVTAVIVEVLLRFEVRVHSTIERGGSSCRWFATNSCKKDRRRGGGGQAGEK